MYVPVDICMYKTPILLDMALNGMIQKILCRRKICMYVYIYIQFVHHAIHYTVHIQQLDYVNCIFTSDYGDLWISQEKTSQGRLEFENNNGVRGAICDTGFTALAANVACKQLGFASVEKVLYQKL